MTRAQWWEIPPPGEMPEFAHPPALTVGTQSDDHCTDTGLLYANGQPILRKNAVGFGGVETYVLTRAPHTPS